MSAVCSCEADLDYYGNCSGCDKETLWAKLFDIADNDATARHISAQTLWDTRPGQRNRDDRPNWAELKRIREAM